MDAGHGELTSEENNDAWRERYGDMVPKKIIDTKIGPDGRRYYKVQWNETTMEKGNNLLEAELLIKKYWDPVEKKLKLHSSRVGENNHTKQTDSTGNRSSGIDDSNQINVLSVKKCGLSSSSTESKIKIEDEAVCEGETEKKSSTSVENIHSDPLLACNVKSEGSSSTENIRKENIIKNCEVEEVVDSQVHSCRRKRVNLNEDSELFDLPPKKLKDNCDD